MSYVRDRRVQLGDMPDTSVCRVSLDMIRYPGGHIEKVANASTYPWCAGYPQSPTRGPIPSAAPTNVRTLARTRIADMPAITLGPGVPSSSATPVTSPVVAPTPPKPPGGTSVPTRSSGLVPGGPTSSSSPSTPSPIVSVPSPVPTSPAMTPIVSPVVVVAPSSPPVVRPQITTNITTPASPAPSNYVSTPTITIAPTPARKTPWLAIGLAVLGAAVLLRK